MALRQLGYTWRYRPELILRFDFKVNNLLD